MIVGGYTLELICDGEHDPVWKTPRKTFAGHNRQACNGQAKQLGWTQRKRIAYCPACAFKRLPKWMQKNNESQAHA